MYKLFMLFNFLTLSCILSKNIFFKSLKKIYKCFLDEMFYLKVIFKVFSHFFIFSNSYMFLKSKIFCKLLLFFNKNIHMKLLFNFLYKVLFLKSFPTQRNSNTLTYFMVSRIQISIFQIFLLTKFCLFYYKFLCLFFFTKNLFTNASLMNSLTIKCVQLTLHTIHVCEINYFFHFDFLHNF
uniref:Transmembrane protein n=1 Tax=Lotharella vacuolata TaxID=74820 RepID=A0A0H5BHU9_9EUKA|nr:hypothetical protein [Lotharella vacuolata]